MESVSDLFAILSEIFPNQANGAEFDVNSVPFGFYEVVRTVPESNSSYSWDL